VHLRHLPCQLPATSYKHGLPHASCKQRRFCVNGPRSCGTSFDSIYDVSTTSDAILDVTNIYDRTSTYNDSGTSHDIDFYGIPRCDNLNRIWCCSDRLGGSASHPTMVAAMECVRSSATSVTTSGFGGHSSYHLRFGSGSRSTCFASCCSAESYASFRAESYAIFHTGGAFVRPVHHPSNDQWPTIADEFDCNADSRDHRASYEWPTNDDEPAGGSFPSNGLENNEEKEHQQKIEEGCLPMLRVRASRTKRTSRFRRGLCRMIYERRVSVASVERCIKLHQACLYSFWRLEG